ncbi:ABC transporter permease [Streptomyces sp. NPDC002577]
MRRHVRTVLMDIWLPAVLLALWWAVSAGSESIYFPPFTDIASRFRDLWLFEQVPVDLLPSLGRLGIGFAAAVVVGVGFGTVLGLARPLEGALRPLMEFVRAIPGLAVLPLAMVVLGTGSEMKTTMIAFVACWPILLNTIDGVRSVEPVLLDVARSFRMGYRHRLARIVLPAACPQIFAGARTALAVGVVVMAVTEMVGTPGGIGYFILNAQRNFDLVEMWTGIIALGITGYLINNVFRLVEAWVLGWHRKMTAHASGGTR